MEEQIYQSVWDQVFSRSWDWAARTQADATPEICGAFAAAAADHAAASAVQHWDESKRRAVIVAKNKEQP